MSLSLLKKTWTSDPLGNQDPSQANIFACEIMRPKLLYSPKRDDLFSTALNASEAFFMYVSFILHISNYVEFASLLEIYRVMTFEKLNEWSDLYPISVESIAFFFRIRIRTWGKLRNFLHHILTNLGYFWRIQGYVNTKNYWNRHRFLYAADRFSLYVVSSLFYS